MKRYLPFAIILVALLLAVGGGALLLHLRRPPPPKLALGKPGAEPVHRRGAANAPVELEEFGDFECLPCFILWPAMKNIESDYGKNLSVIFRQHPLEQHHHALEAARAAEAAGLQGRFWEMHDLLYLKRSEWVKTGDLIGFFKASASDLGLDVERFTRDMDGEAVARRIAADQERGASLGIDRTPVIFVNGKTVQFSPQPEEGLRMEIDAALRAKAR